MKRRQKTRLTPREVSLAVAAQSFRTARVWRVHWLHAPPTLARYQAPVPLVRVLAEHRGAAAAEPVGD